VLQLPALLRRGIARVAGWVENRGRLLGLGLSVIAGVAGWVVAFSSWLGL
jgi:hypothetical protein